MANRIVLFFLISVLIASCAKQSDTDRPPKDAAVSTSTRAEEQGPYRIDVDTTVEIGGYIRNMLEDSQGNFWFGTVAGACRYDGKAFSPFTLPAAARDDYPTGVSSPRVIWSTYEDSEGNIWFATNGAGVYRYDSTSLTNLSAQDGLCGDFVSGIVQDRLGNLWFATLNHGICRYDGQAFTQFTKADGVNGDEVCQVYQDRAGNIWFPSEGYGVYRYDDKSMTNFGQKDGLGILAVQSIFEDTQERLWFGGGGGLYRYDGETFIKVTKQGPWE